MKVRYTRHAEKRILERKISKHTIREVLNSPDSIEEAEDHLIFQKYLGCAESNTYLIRVFVVLKEEAFLVITAYMTSKVKKYFVD